MKITKLQERKAKTTGKRYYVINVEGDDQDYLSFDSIPEGIVGQEVDALKYTKDGKNYIRNIKLSNSNDFVNEDQLHKERANNRFEDDRKYGTTLSYAKDVLVALASEEMRRNPSMVKEEALDWIASNLEEVHKVFLDALINAQN